MQRVSWKRLWCLFWRWPVMHILQHVPCSWVNPVCMYSFSLCQHGLGTGFYSTLPATICFSFRRRPLFFDAGTLAINSSVFGWMELAFTDLCYLPNPLRTERAFGGSTLSLHLRKSVLSCGQPMTAIFMTDWTGTLAVNASHNMVLTDLLLDL